MKDEDKSTEQLLAELRELRKTTGGLNAELFKQEQKKLHEAEELIDTLSILMGTFSPQDGRLLFVNKAYCNYFGMTKEELLGRSFLDLIPEEDRAAVWNTIAALDKDNPFNVQEHPVHTPDGQRWQRWTNQALIDEQGQVVRFLAFGEDITERKQLEAQMRQSQKMEAIGVLAGGIAHEFNNLLTPILGYADLLARNKTSDDPDHHGLQQIQRAGNRAREMVQQMLAYGRQSLLPRSPVDLGQLVEEATQLLQRTIPARVRIKKKIELGLPAVLGVPNEIHQVILNLCINASHAMPDGGELTISVERATAHKFVDSNGARQQGDFLKLSIRDTGTGMDTETIEKIFDPFFSTKRVGEGSGLGLSVAQGIVDQHQGHVRVESKMGQGSTFRVYLPVSPASEAVEATRLKRPTVLPRGQERVLLVDDDPMIIEIAAKMLTSLGYEVQEFSNCAAGLECIRQRPHAFDIVITDYGMPDMSGKQLAEALVQIRADIPIVLMTGYGDLVAREEVSRWGIHGTLLKPFGFEEIGNAVRQALKQGS